MIDIGFGLTKAIIKNNESIMKMLKRNIIYNIIFLVLWVLNMIVFYHTGDVVNTLIVTALLCAFEYWALMLYGLAYRDAYNSLKDTAKQFTTCMNTETEQVGFQSQVMGEPFERSDEDKKQEAIAKEYFALTDTYDNGIEIICKSFGKPVSGKERLQMNANARNVIRELAKHYNMSTWDIKECVRVHNKRGRMK